MIAHDDFLIVVAVVHVPRQHELLGVVHALNGLSLGFGRTQRRQQHRREDGNDCDDD